MADAEALLTVLARVQCVIKSSKIKELRGSINFIDADQRRLLTNPMRRTEHCNSDFIILKVLCFL
jgi:hypothetical protein